jgi:hypothetical protein
MVRSKSLRRGLTRLDEVVVVAEKDYGREFVFHHMALGDQELDLAYYIRYPRFAYNTIYCYGRRVSVWKCGVPLHKAE